MGSSPSVSGSLEASDAGSAPLASSISACSSTRLRIVRGRFSRGSTRSSIPCSIRKPDVWKPSGSFARIVCSITAGPAKPMWARGSAISTSPSVANEALTPP